MITCNFNNTITERDMDLLLAEAIYTEQEFCRLLIDKTDLKGRSFKVIMVEVSKADNDLGESDITVIVQIDGKKYGVLIEDKIDAMAMPDQHGRYLKRGDKGIKAGEYDEYRVFICCPEKYLQSNCEAKLYEHVLTYEECRDYFKAKDDALSSFRFQQLSQAIRKSKRPTDVNVNEKANAFLRQYIQYQKENFPSLDLSTKENRNGWWTDYRTELGRAYINHKIQQGFVDLTFPKTADNFNQMRIVVDWLRNHGMPDAVAIKTKRSTMIRVRVPKIDLMAGFDVVDKSNLNNCFEVVKQLTDFANTVELLSSLVEKAE